ncbi:endonuclease/exonuclease/phosphatase family protein [Actinacidiphila sp. bgisy144]|uniref:endonuclease/exonuclease/phosphatase family protein n=1 Tax=Actinacidiphila sp. bgisy144 TaxID=3413791 RepID=UPI003EC0678B
MTEPTSSHLETSMKKLVAVTANIEDNGRTSAQRQKAREILRSIGPDIVFRQELPGAHYEGYRELQQEANFLGGLVAFMCLPQPGKASRPVGVMVSPTVFEILSHEERGQGWKPACIVRVRFRGTDRVLQLASHHLCHNDGATRATEALGLTDLADHGGTALIGMDANSYPVPSPLEVTLPNLDSIDDPVHFEHRTIWRDGQRVPDTAPDEILTGAHRKGSRPGPFIDLGRYAAYNLGQPEALTPTASLHRTDQGPRTRIDRIYATPNLAPALTSVTVDAGDDVVAVTDHALVVATFDRKRMIEAL